MTLAWEEIKYQPKKYILIELLIVLMLFMVLFLTGLSNGLGREVSAQIDNYGNLTYILKDDAKGNITYSNMTQKDKDNLSDKALTNLSGLTIQRANVTKDGKGDKKDISYFAIETSKLLNPDISQGKALSTGKEVVLDDSFKREGIRIGDKLKDSASELSLTVVGFTKDAKYGHSAIGFISKDTYVAMRQANQPHYEWLPQAYVTDHQLSNKDLPSSLKAYQKQSIIEQIPGYQAEHLTLTMITWVLLLASAAILGVFFYILTLQKLHQFGVLKAIGFTMSKIALAQILQIVILASIGISVGILATLGLAQVMPSGMPFFLEYQRIVVVALSFVAITVTCGALSLLKVRQVDPVQVIGGNGE
ncbi:ABC transporter permease [Streptococcus hongkongensis]|nr:ABC transporter permease [Streptococcus uberis]